MSYQALLVYNSQGEFAGYVIHKQGTAKLHDTNLWGEEDGDELRESIDKLNEASDLKQFWPSYDDPEVQALLKNSSWEPFATREELVVDQARLEAMIENGDLVPDPAGLVPEDQVPKFMAKVAIDPKAPMQRIRKAQELIASQRASQ